MLEEAARLVGTVSIVIKSNDSSIMTSVYVLFVFRLSVLALKVGVKVVGRPFREC